MDDWTEIECPNRKVAEQLRLALKGVDGVEVDYERFAKGGAFDVGVLVDIIVSGGSLAGASAAIVYVLNKAGFTSIKISGKVTVLNLIAVETALEAKKPAVRAKKAAPEGL